jgi:hypothetical protein
MHRHYTRLIEKTWGKIHSFGSMHDLINSEDIPTEIKENILQYMLDNNLSFWEKNDDGDRNK